MTPSSDEQGVATQQNPLALIIREDPAKEDSEDVLLPDEVDRDASAPSFSVQLRI